MSSESIRAEVLKEEINKIYEECFSVVGKENFTPDNRIWIKEAMFRSMRFIESKTRTECEKEQRENCVEFYEKEIRKVRKEWDKQVKEAEQRVRAECRKEHIHHFNPECDGCKEDVSCVLEEAEQRGFKKGRDRKCDRNKCTENALIYFCSIHLDQRLEQAEQDGFNEGMNNVQERAEAARQDGLKEGFKKGEINYYDHCKDEKLCFNPDHESILPFPEVVKKIEEIQKNAKLELLDDLEGKAYCITSGIHICKKNPDNCTLVIDEEELTTKRREIEEG